MFLEVFSEFNYMLLLFVMILLMMLSFKSFLLILICLEFLLILILHLILMLSDLDLNDWLFLVVLIMGVCESLIGLGLMISMIFLFGNQSVKVLNLMW